MLSRSRALICLITLSVLATGLAAGFTPERVVAEELVLDASAVDLQPRVRATPGAAGALLLELSLPALRQSTLTVADQSYQVLEIPDGGLRGAPDEEALPTLTRLIAIPDGATVTARVVAAKTVTLSGDYRLLARQPLRDGINGQAPEPVIATRAADGAGTATPLDAALVVVGKAARLGNLRVLPVTFQPVRRDPISGKLTETTRMEPVTGEFEVEDTIRNPVLFLDRWWVIAHTVCPLRKESLLPEESKHFLRCEFLFLQLLNNRNE